MAVPPNVSLMQPPQATPPMFAQQSPASAATDPQANMIMLLQLIKAMQAGQGGGGGLANLLAAKGAGGGGGPMTAGGGGGLGGLQAP